MLYISILLLASCLAWQHNRVRIIQAVTWRTSYVVLRHAMALISSSYQCDTGLLLHNIHNCILDGPW